MPNDDETQTFEPEIVYEPPDAETRAEVLEQIQTAPADKLYQFYFARDGSLIEAVFVFDRGESAVQDAPDGGYRIVQGRAPEMTDAELERRIEQARPGGDPGAIRTVDEDVPDGDEFDAEAVTEGVDVPDASDYTHGTPPDAVEPDADPEAADEADADADADAGAEAADE